MNNPLSIYDSETMRPLARTGSTQTSVLAAIETTANAPAMIDRIWALSAEGPFTPEEATARLQAENDKDGRGRVLLTSVRARICGLHKAGRLTDSGERGLGESNRSKVVKWRRTTPAEMSEAIAKRAATEEAKGAAS